jgi:hypothetical protein
MEYSTLTMNFVLTEKKNKREIRKEQQLFDMYRIGKKTTTTTTTFS